MSTSGAVGILLAGLGLLGLGLVLATDFRGFTRWHAKLTIQFAHPLTRVPPWRSLPERLKDPEAAIDRQYALARVVGWAFAFLGAVFFINGLVHLVR